MFVNLYHWVAALPGVVLFAVTFAMIMFVCLVAAGIAYLAFNALSPLKDSLLVRGKEGGEHGTRWNFGYIALRLCMFTGQLFAMSTLAYVPWGWRNGEWDEVFVWVGGFNLVVIFVLLATRFVAAEHIVFKKVNNLKVIVAGNRPVLLVECVMPLCMGFILRAINSGKAPSLLEGVQSAAFYTGLAWLVFVGLSAYAVRRKVHLGDNDERQSLSDGMKHRDMRKSMYAAVKICGSLLFITLAIIGAVQGDFTNWPDSFKTAAVVFGTCIVTTLLLNSLFVRGLRRAEKHIPAKLHVWMAALASLPLAGFAFLTTGAATGALMTLMG